MEELNDDEEYKCSSRHSTQVSTQGHMACTEEVREGFPDEVTKTGSGKVGRRQGHSTDSKQLS